VVKLIGDDPWQQFVDAIDGVLGDASDDVAQVGLGIKAIQFGGTNQSVDCGPAFAAAVGAEVQIVLSAESKFAIILPISGRKLKSIIDGTRCMGTASRLEMLSSAAESG
jgi:hypothetical protein